MVHREDIAELLTTATVIEHHAQHMLAGDAATWERARLQNIVVLIRYMKEHLEMLPDRSEPVDARP